jgi:hypothetical protein
LLLNYNKSLQVTKTNNILNVFIKNTNIDSTNLSRGHFKKRVLFFILNLKKANAIFVFLFSKKSFIQISRLKNDKIVFYQSYFLMR